MTPSNQECLTISVPEAGRLAFGLSRNAAYRAAERGDIPVIRVGRLFRVPTAWLRKVESGQIAA